LSGLLREVRLLEGASRRSKRRALFFELEAWMRRVRTLDQVLERDTS